MIYYIGKIFQAAGLTLLLISFLRKFPHLMSYRELFIGIVLFAVGWVINQFMLQK